MDKAKPYIEGRIAWDCFPHNTFFWYPRYVNGVKRRPLFVELDGVRYVRETHHDNCEVLD